MSRAAIGGNGVLSAVMGRLVGVKTVGNRAEGKIKALPAAWVYAVGILGYFCLAPADTLPDILEIFDFISFA
ncbi:hypothetical protein F4U94_16865 [Sphingobium limneticum]|uniref:hypothetical protein n=1 Tax=Sphingobium limneticum TaxID=1007511 RepID=UPI00123D67C4|nr:hypothetical protein [Sphingobium limneticum]KAA9013206.1 hypothetical protein F4U94_16865 [Sphingobium limneticum]